MTRSIYDQYADSAPEPAYRNLVRRVFTWLQQPIGEVALKSDKDSKGKKKKHWGHGFVPLTPEAARIKDHKKKGSANDAPAKVIGSKAFHELSPAQQKRVRQEVADKRAAARTEEATSDAEAKATGDKDKVKKKIEKRGEAKKEQAQKASETSATNKAKAAAKDKAEAAEEKRKKASKGLPTSVWRGRAQRLSRLSPEALARSIRQMSDSELTALRKAIGHINDNQGASVGDSSLSKITGLLDKEVSRRTKRSSK